MLTMQDCLDYCDLTDEDVELFAQHEHIPCEVATAIVCSLCQSDEGIELICSSLSSMIQEAVSNGRLDKAEHVLHVYTQFRSAHPLVH
jgi:hypothetical protein